MNSLTVKARAKINLALDVLYKRPDGYHELSMVMQSIRLHDTLLIKKTDKPGVHLTCDRDNPPADENNLVYKAVKYLIDSCRIASGVSVKLTKKIPVSAGLGGGSSDCAAALTGVNELFNLGLTREQLMQTSRKFGADVPFCVMRGTALAEGTGEKLTALPQHPPVYIVLVCPGIYVSTADIYREWTAHTPGQSRIQPLMDALRNQDIQGIAACFSNGLTGITSRQYPEIQNLIDEMITLGAINASMSGSGPAVFGYFESRPRALACYRALQRHKTLRGLFLTGIFIPNTGR
jgi:4-diphosphocytidyl-2-C-methyl-D-erythritol kinase